MVSSTPELEPRTQEVWVGVKRPVTRTSALQRLVDDLRARLTGLTAYQVFLRGSASFDAYETNLGLVAEQVAEIDGDDVSDTRSTLDDAFASWSDYKGDPSSDTGVYDQADYDAYRGYLTSNGVSDIDADLHIQTLTALFDPDTTAAYALREDDDWSDLEADVGAATVATLQSVYGSVVGPQLGVLRAVAWSDFESELVDRGLDNSDATSVVSSFQSAYGDPLEVAVRDQLASIDTYPDLNLWLRDQGVSSHDAARWTTILQAQDLALDDYRRIVATRGLDGLLNAVPHEDAIDGLEMGAIEYEIGDHLATFSPFSTGYVSKLTVRNDVLYVINGRSGVETLYTFDVSDPNNISQLDSIGIGSAESFVINPDGTRLWLDDTNTLVDISDASNLSTIDTPSSTLWNFEDAVWVDDNRIVAILDEEVGIIDTKGSDDVDTWTVDGYFWTQVEMNWIEESDGIFYGGLTTWESEDSGAGTAFAIAENDSGTPYPVPLGYPRPPAEVLLRQGNRRYWVDGIVYHAEGWSVDINDVIRITEATVSGVTEEPEADYTDLTWTNTEVGDSIINPGESTSVAADVTNPTNAPATVTAKLIVNSATETTQPVSVDANDTRTVTFAFSVPASGTIAIGEYACQINNSPPVTVRVEPQL